MSPIPSCEKHLPHTAMPLSRCLRPLEVPPMRRPPASGRPAPRRRRRGPRWPASRPRRPVRPCRRRRRRCAMAISSCARWRPTTGCRAWSAHWPAFHCLGDGVQAAARQDRAVGVADHHRLRGLEHQSASPRLPIAERHRGAARAAGLGALLGGALLAADLRSISQLATAPLMRANSRPLSVLQVGLAAHRGQCEMLLVGQVDEVLELEGLAVQPVQVPGHHRVDAARRGYRRASAGSPAASCRSTPMCRCPCIRLSTQPFWAHSFSQSSRCRSTASMLPSRSSDCRR